MRRLDAIPMNKLNRVIPFLTWIKFLLILAIVFFVWNDDLRSTPIRLVDTDATEETQRLYRNLMELSPKYTLFGHQNTNLYGVNWVEDDDNSDVYEVTGAFPAVYGYDFLSIGIAEYFKAERTATYDDFIRYAKWAAEKGSVVTFGWHQPNPVTRGSFYDKTPALHTLLPGGDNHEEYKGQLDKIAHFFKQVAPSPIIFRPFHEHNGDWFWWGKGFCTEEDYRALWQFMVRYLRDEQGVNNVLYAFSPDRSRINLDHFETEYLYAYPGDDYVDILGLDNYWDLGHEANKRSKAERLEDLTRSLELLNALGESKGKLTALTETGLEAIPEPKWWTETLLAGINATEQSRKIAYLMVWRNANRERENMEHFYAPYKGHSSAADFIEFKNDESILFEDELPDLYSN